MLSTIRSLCLFVLIGSVLSACGPSAAQLEATARSIASTQLARIPTGTLPPTATASSTPTITSSPTEESSPTATSTPSAFVSAENLWPYGQPERATYEAAQANKSDQYTPLLLINQSGAQRIEFIVTSPQYQDYVFSTTLGLVLPQASYTYQAWIGDKGPFNGSFVLNHQDKYELIFYSDRVHFTKP